MNTSANPAPPDPTTTGAVEAFIGLGANLGDPAATVQAALQGLAQLSDTALVAHSSLYASAPVDAQGPEFVNAVALLRTRLPPLQLLAALQQLEAGAGRKRPYRNAPRTLDLDILLYGDTVCHTAQLTLPHPRLHLRRFVLWPLSELAPGLHLPGLGPLPPLLQAVAGQAVSRRH